MRAPLKPKRNISNTGSHGIIEISIGSQYQLCSCSLLCSQRCRKAWWTFWKLLLSSSSAYLLKAKSVCHKFYNHRIGMLASSISSFDHSKAFAINPRPIVSFSTRFNLWILYRFNHFPQKITSVACITDSLFHRHTHFRCKRFHSI